MTDRHRNDPPHVALCAPGEVFGGVETQILGLGARLAAATGRPPALLLFHDRELAERARGIGLEPIVLPCRHRYDPGASRALVRAVAASGADVLHVHGYRAMVTAAVAGDALPVPTVKTEHGLPEPGGGLLASLKTGLNARLDAWATRRLGALVCYVTADIMARCGDAHAGLERRVVYNGIEPLDGTGLRRPEALDPDRIDLGIVGRISEVKGIEYAVRALAEPGMPDALRLHVIGSGPEAPALERLVAELGLAERVVFHGFRRDVLDWMAHLDVLLMPSLHEGLPYTLLEAMSLGRPVVASRVGGLAETLVDGETGLLVEVGDVGGLAAAIRRLAVEPGLAARLGEAAAARQRRAYTLETMTDAYLQAYADA